MIHYYDPCKHCKKKFVLKLTIVIYMFQEMRKKSTSSSSTQKMIVMKSAFDKDIFIPTSKVKEAMTSSAPRPKFADNFRGCDWIQEVSVTIRKTKRTQVPKERYFT